MRIFGWLLFVLALAWLALLAWFWWRVLKPANESHSKTGLPDSKTAVWKRSVD